MLESRHLPGGEFRGSLDPHLPRIEAALATSLVGAQKNFQRDTLRLSKPRITELASVLVEFAEDVHCQIRIWHSLEQSHREFYGTPLPFVIEPSADRTDDSLSPTRIQHLLWVLYPRLKTDLILSPDHVDLVHLAQVASETLRKRFARLPKDSGLKQFLETSDDHAWQVKRKLIWLGTQSYLFWWMFRDYAKEQEKSSAISIMDDFVCQQCTEWSGLGVLDILARALDLSPQRRSDLLSWYERHVAVYRVLSGNSEVLELRNLVNDRNYRVRMELERNPFTKRMIVVGALVPWDGEWAWSGEQQAFQKLGQKQIDSLTEGYRRLPTIAYRYCKDDLEKARGFVRDQYRDFVARHGKDWIVFPDGLAMAADWQEEARRRLESLPDAERRKFMKRHGLDQPWPKINLPPDLLEERDGIGVYFNPEEGQEMIGGFHVILSGLKRQGADLSQDEADAIRGWVRSPAISPGFVRRLVNEFGSKSIKAAFLLDQRNEEYVLDYLLRRYKGVFYRNRYPTLTIVK